ncbi:TLP18.3, Psb32 and MOLO-1 founding proteins of phosphatase-domain-containing protein [Scenedesmus sp. NREL 46B-D3]|nr:TLP18.3, Psb32 and MOLO-1 founding proteins of phosphatase-domain-containing protein [Scenedesmus sp. NREL 46B-D3]
MESSSSRRARLLVTCLVLFSCAVAQAKPFRKWSPATYPNPQKDVYDCGRDGRKSSVCDPDNILSKESANMVEGLINEIAEATPPFRSAECGSLGQKGFQVAVALMHKMDHAKHADKAATAKAFARALHDAWGVGDPECQNGLLVLMAINDREVYISSGRGVKSVVSDDQLSMVLDNIKPALKHKRYADAVLEAVQQLGLLVSGQTPDKPGIDSDDGWGIFAFFCMIVTTVIGWAWYSQSKQNARFERCANKLNSIKRDQAAIRSRQYAATSCPICLEDFDVPAPAGTSSAAAAAAAPSGSSMDGAGADAPAPSAPLLSGSSSGAGAGAGSSSAAAAAAAGAGSSSGRGSRRVGKSASGKGQAAKKPLVLRCGHAFCDPCISQWLKSHTNCPICRKDLEDQEEQPPAAEQPPASCGAAAGTGVRAQHDVIQQQVWLPELGFRLRRLRMMYPDFVTDPMVYAWEEDIAAGRSLNMGVVQQFEARNPARQQQLEASGRQGASSSASFGGGSTYGGGGAGSSW